MNVITLGDLSSLSEEELNNLCFHFSSINNMESIDENGLFANKGVHSTGELGNEKTKKVFFSKGYIPALSLINLSLEKCTNLYNNGKVELMQKIGMDPTLDVKSSIIDLLSKNIYYILDIKGVSKSEYDTLSEEEKSKVSYLTDDLDEESGKVMESANMHTISNTGVVKEQLYKIVDDNFEVASVLDVVSLLASKFKELHPESEFPTRHQTYNYMEDYYNEGLLKKSRLHK